MPPLPDSLSPSPLSRIESCPSVWCILQADSLPSQLAGKPVCVCVCVYIYIYIYIYDEILLSHIEE